MAKSLRRSLQAINYLFVCIVYISYHILCDDHLRRAYYLCAAHKRSHKIYISIYRVKYRTLANCNPSSLFSNSKIHYLSRKMKSIINILSFINLVTISCAFDKGNDVPFMECGAEETMEKLGKFRKLKLINISLLKKIIIQPKIMNRK